MNVLSSEMGDSLCSVVKFRPLDFLFIVLTIFAVGLCCYNLFRGQNGNPVLSVQSGKEKWVYPLNENREFSVKGILGETKVVIENGAAFFAASPCENKTCLAGGKIATHGMWIACLPNGVFAMVEGSEDSSQVDALSF